MTSIVISMILLSITTATGILIFIVAIMIFVVYVIYDDLRTQRKKSEEFLLKFKELEKLYQAERIQNENGKLQSTKDLEAKLKEKHLIYLQKEAEMKVRLQNWALEEFEKFKKTDVLRIQKIAEEQALNAANVKLKEWKFETKSSIRQNAINRSYSVNLGKISEHLMPFHEKFLSLGLNPHDTRFIGSPIDLIVFDGYSEQKEEVDIWIIEVKTGKSAVTKDQKKIRDAIKNNRIHWQELRLDEKKSDNDTKTNVIVSNTQLNIFNFYSKEDIDKAISKIGVSREMYFSTLSRIKTLINSGNSADEAITLNIKGVTFKNGEHKQLLVQTLKYSLKLEAM